jgi:para-nitrobenzyl esterase
MANDVASAPTTQKPVVEITSGKLRGTSAAGVYAFKGVPYGASTAGRNRFLLPQLPQPWSGERDALAYAGHAPQSPNRPKRRPELDTILGPADATPEGEDCLTLNVWTPGLGDGAKRPVMVWLHGGGFAYGSANRAVTDGANLVRRGDVVVVGVNHRLNILGFLHLGDIAGPAWAHSGNAGALDLIAALRWVRENIDRFGGNPGNVTIFGESGGGGKVSVLLAMPAARGLFHRAIIQSGAAIRVSTRERANALAEAVLKEVGVGRAQCDRLQALPAEQLLAAMAPASRAVGRTKWPLLDRYDFGPVVDGSDLPHHPGEPSAPEIADDIPLMIGGTKEESAFFLADDDAVWNGTLREDAFASAPLGGGQFRDRRSACRLSRSHAAREPRGPADRSSNRLQLLDPVGVAGGMLRGAAAYPGLYVLARLAEPGTWRPLESASRDGSAFCFRQCRCAGHDRRGPRRPRAGRTNFSNLDCLCPKRDT